MSDITCYVDSYTQNYTLCEENQRNLFHLKLGNCILTNFNDHCTCLNVIPLWGIIVYVFLCSNCEGEADTNGQNVM